VSFVGGESRFALARDKSSLARDFVDQLAALHKLDAQHVSLASLGDPNEAQSRSIRKRIAELQSENLGAGADPILQLGLLWLSQNVPADMGHPVVLHGDAGPGNFLFEDDRVSALVNWEFAHLDDPMEDLGQIWVRSLIQPFVPMADVIASYEAATATKVDIGRVRFHRLYFQLGFSVSSAALAAAPGSLSGATGTALLYGTMHRRVMVRSVGELAGVELVDPVLPDCPPDLADNTFASALLDLRHEIVPHISNQRGSAKAKELVRLVKYWRRRASHGAAFDASELEDIRSLLPKAPDDLLAARRLLAEAISVQRSDSASALQVSHNRVVRETFLMSDAMGSLATAWFDEIDGSRVDSL
jgi:hypothetical protein